MKQDVVADGLNMIMNAKRAGKTEVRINKISKVLVNVLEKMKNSKYIDYEVVEEEENKPSLVVKILKLNLCKAVKPRFSVTVDRIDKYIRRYLPSRNFGVLLVSTNKGIVSHTEAYEKNLGGSLIAYYY